MVVIHTPMESPGSTKSAQAKRVFRAGRAFSHLMADTEAELRTYAKSIGLPTNWIQDSGTPRAHFDVTGRYLALVESDPRVIKMSLREWVDWRKAILNIEEAA